MNNRQKIREFAKGRGWFSPFDIDFMDRHNAVVSCYQLATYKRGLIMKKTSAHRTLYRTDPEYIPYDPLNNFKKGRPKVKAEQGARLITMESLDKIDGYFSRPLRRQEFRGIPSSAGML